MQPNRPIPPTLPYRPIDLDRATQGLRRLAANVLIDALRGTEKGKAEDQQREHDFLAGAGARLYLDLTGLGAKGYRLAEAIDRYKRMDKDSNGSGKPHLPNKWKIGSRSNWPDTGKHD